jgi:tetratricopeptide (TPR) repeat protein
MSELDAQKMSTTRSLPSSAEWTEQVCAGVRAERVEIEVSELALRTVAGPEEVRRIASEAAQATGHGLVLDGHLLAVAMERGARDPKQGFQDLGAEFAYPLAPLLNELRVQGGFLLVLADALNTPDERQGPQPDASLHPRWAETRELFAEGCAKAAELLFPEAIEWLSKAEDRYPTDFSVQFELGWIYLYGVSRQDSVFNPIDAEVHLRRAVRYGQGAVRRRPEMAAPAAETMLHLSIACHLLDRTEESLELCAEACRINPKLSQAYYHRAKYAARLGRTDEAVAAARAALELDRRFALTLDTDRDLGSVTTPLHQMLDEMRAEARRQGERAVAAGADLGGLKAQTALFRTRLTELETRLRNVEARASDYPADYGEMPGVCTDVRRSFDEEGRNARRALEKLGRVVARAESSLAEAETMFERCRILAAEDTLFALQDVLVLAVDAATPLRRATTNLADAAEYSRAGEEHIPRMEARIGALAVEAGKNRAARRNWGVMDFASRVASRLPGFVIAGALAGILIRVAICFAAGQFRELGVSGLVNASLVFAGLGAAAGAVAAAFRAVRRFGPAGR